MRNRRYLFNGLAVAGGVAICATAVAAPKPTTATTGVAASNVQIQLPASASIDGGLVAGSDGAYYADYDVTGSGFYTYYLARITDTGNVSVLNSNTTAPYSGLQFDRDGNLVGQSYLVGSPAYGAIAPFGTFFRVTPGGAFAVLASYDFSAYSTEVSSNTFVQGADGAYYGIATFADANPLLYKVTASGGYQTICSVATDVEPDALVTMSSVIAGSDGNLYGIYGTSVFRLTPSCGYRVVYSATSTLTSLAMGGDGNLYVADVSSPYGQAAGSTSRVFKLTTGGIATDLHEFGGDTYLAWFRGYWDRILGWVPGHWGSVQDAINVDGFYADHLIQGADGYLYGSTTRQGLNGGGTVFRLSTDGSQFSTLYAAASAADFSALPWSLMINAQGDPVLPLLSHDNSTEYLSTLKLDAPLATSVSFSRPQVTLGQSSVLSWSSTGAQSCQLIGDLPGWKTKSVAVNGSKTVRLYSTSLRTPPSYTAGIECSAADGSVSNAAATITIQ